MLEDNYFTVKEVAERLRLRPSAVCALVKRQKLLAVEVGGAVRIGRRELEDYLNGTVLQPKTQHKVVIPKQKRGKEPVLSFFPVTPSSQYSSTTEATRESRATH